jgi:GNAT superfamily N-acetyltransferase
MSLYTLNVQDSLPTLKPRVDIQVEESVNIELLSAMSSSTPIEIINRLANDHSAYIAKLNGIPVAFGWVARDSAFIGELNHRLILPYRHRYLWNFRTLEPFRGLGVYPTLLQRIIELERPKADTFWIIHAPENNASLRGIEKAGFQYVGKLYNTGTRTKIEATASASENKEFLDEMDIEIANCEPASCWNCSSPFLKKRNSACCCAVHSKPCVGNNLAVLMERSQSPFRSLRHQESLAIPAS